MGAGVEEGEAWTAVRYCCSVQKKAARAADYSCLCWVAAVAEGACPSYVAGGVFHLRHRSFRARNHLAVWTPKQVRGDDTPKERVGLY